MSSTSPDPSATPAESPPGASATAPAAESATESGPRFGAATTALGAALVLAVWALVTLWGPAGIPFHTKGEPREALVVREILLTGNWVLPRVNEVEIPSKPPLFHWLGALVALARGTTDEWSARLPSALLSLAGILAIYVTGAALWGARAGVVAALTLATSFEWVRAATTARVDMALTVGLEAAFLSWLFFVRSGSGRWLVPLYLGIAFATLAKGPVGIVLPGAVALASMAVRRDFSPLLRMRLLRGVLVVAVLAGCWYALAAHREGRDFFVQHILRENVFRVFDADPGPGDYQGHRHSALWLAGVLLLGFLPWTVFLPGVLSRLWHNRATLTRDHPAIYCGVWAVVVFALYAVAVSKRGVYLLGLYPAIALLVAWQLEEQQRAAADDRWLLRGLAVAAAAMFVAVAALTAISAVAALGLPIGVAVQHLLPAASPPYGTAVAAVLAGGGAALFGALAVALAGAGMCVRAARAGWWVGTFGGLLATTVAAIVIANVVAMPTIATEESARTFVARAERVVAAGESVAFYRTPSYAVLYYWRRPIPVYTGSTADRGPRYLVITRADWAGGDAALRRSYEPVLRPDDAALGEAYKLMLVRRVTAR